MVQWTTLDLYINVADIDAQNTQGDEHKTAHQPDAEDE
jgi:hypothetical protein